MDEGALSFKSYNKVDEQEEQAYIRRTRKRAIIIGISVIVLVAIIIGAVVGTLGGKKSNDGQKPEARTSVAESITAMCNVTRYPDSCFSSMSSALEGSSNGTNSNPGLVDLFLLSLQISRKEVSKLSSVPGEIISSSRYSKETSNPLVQSALRDCETLFSDAVDQIDEAISSIQVDQGEKTVVLTSKINQIRTWLSSAITYQSTCIYGLQEAGMNLSLTDDLRYAMTYSTEYTSNSLAIATNVLTILADLNISFHRKLLTVHDHHGHDVGFPTWVRRKDRRLLQEENPKPDLTVAKDGTGDFKTIKEAVNSVPKKSKKRFVIYVKEGVYLEQVIVDKDYWNVMMYGDGMNKTIVSGSLNMVGGTLTFHSGSFIVNGRGFMGRDMGVKNTAGREKEQAVALRSSSEQSVFYRCSFDAYQDTLYVHANTQFYRECLITGTVDFIFGNAAVVFQNCSIQPREPQPQQFNTITAQSKTDPNQNTGISLHRCQLTPFDTLTATTYYGRPWEEYATTVIMESYVGNFLDAKGWSPWKPNIDLPETIFYAEYQNLGPGSGTSGRVVWPGVFPNISSQEAAKFTVDPFIQGSQWLPQASVMFQASLL